MNQQPLPKMISFLRKTAFISLSAFPLLFSQTAYAQDAFKGMENLFTAPKQYTANFAAQAPVVDGDINDQVWAKVPWTTDFTDIEGDRQPVPYFKTRLKMVWDKNFLYVAAEVKDPHIWANVKNHDEVIFQDNDFEIFIDPDNDAQQYFEIEVNAINTIWDLFLPKAYRNGGSGLTSWEARGMRSAVKVQGTVNNAGDKDQGWTVELAIPYAALNILPKENGPEDGSFWRINFSRVQWLTTVVDGKYVKNKDTTGKDLPEHNWVWSPQGIINMHYPERWGYLTFSSAAAGTKTPPVVLPYSETQRKYLWLVYYKEKAYFEAHQHYAASLEELGIAANINLAGQENKLVLEATAHQFYASIAAAQQQTITIDQDGLVHTIKQEGLVQTNQ